MSRSLEVDRRGKYLLLRFESMTFVVHLMQGGRLLADAKRSAKPRGGQARFTFEPIELDRRIDRRHGAAAHRAGQGTPSRGVVRADRRRAHVAAARQARAGGGRRSPPTNWPRCSLRTRCACTGSCATNG